MARKITTTRRAPEIVQSFEANAQRWNEDAAVYAPPASDASEKAEGGEAASLKERIAKLEGQLAAREVPAATVATSIPKAPVPPAAVNYAGLPDPVQDPDGYAKQLGERLLAQANAQRKYEREVADFNAG